MKRILSFILVFVIVLTLLPHNAVATAFPPAPAVQAATPPSARGTTHSGTCGENLTWTLDTGSGLLTISGTGAMTDYAWYSEWSLPFDDEPGETNYVTWLDYRSSIRSIVMEYGITSIGSYAFFECTALKNVSIPDSVTEIGYYAFCNCDGLTSVTVPDSVTEIGTEAFADCINLTSVTVGSSVAFIGNSAFSDCTGLTSVYFTGNVPEIGNNTFQCDDEASETSIINIPGLTLYYLEEKTGWTTPTWNGYPTTVHTHSYTSAVTTAPTCTEQGYTTHTCVCGDSYTDTPVAAPGHSYSGGVCTVCELPQLAREYRLSESIRAGEQVIIYHPESGRAVSLTISTTGLTGVQTTVLSQTLPNGGQLAAFTVGGDDSGYTLLSSDGRYLAVGSANTLTLTDTLTDYCKWAIVPVDGGIHLMNLGATGNQALQYYTSKNKFVTYTVANTAIFTMQLYKLSTCEHVWDAGTVTTAPTCTEKGELKRLCTLCQAINLQEIAPLEHDMVTDAAVAPTCTESGLTEGSHCSRCELRNEQQIIAALGHTFVDEICIVCGAPRPPKYNYSLTETLRAGDKVIIYHPASGATVGLSIVSTGLTGVAATVTEHVISAGEELAAFTVGGDASGYTLLSAEGQYLTAGASGNYLRLEDTVTDCGKWTIALTAGGIHLMNVGAAGNQALQYYTSKNKFVTYSVGNTEIFCMQLYKLTSCVHAWDDGVVTTPPSCIENGELKRTCSKCMAVRRSEIAALGHDMVIDAAVAPTCTEPGLTEGSHCSRCDYTIAQQYIATTGHNFGEEVCIVCGEPRPPKYNYSLTETLRAGDKVIIYHPASGATVGLSIVSTGLTGVAATVTEHVISAGEELTAFTVGGDENGYSLFSSDGRYLTAGSSSSLTLSEALTDYGKWTIVPAQGGVKLKNVGAGSNRALQYYTSKNKFVTASATESAIYIMELYTLSECIHEFDEGVVTTAPSCTEKGELKYTCSKCGTTRRSELPALGHDMVIDAAVAPTCTEPGLTEGSHCSRCDYTIAQQSVPASGHNFGEDVCIVCGEPRPPVYDYTLSQTLTEGNKVIFYHPASGSAVSPTIATTGLSGIAVAVNEQMITAGEEVAIFTVGGDENGYTLCTSDGRYLTSGSSGNTLSLSATLTDCGKWTIVPVSGGVHLMNVGAQNQALEYYTAKNKFVTYSVSNTDIFKIQIFKQLCLEHEFNEGTVTDEPTCTEKGIKTFACLICGKTITEEIPALGHVPVTDAAVSPTCTEPGQTEGSHCSVCSAVLVARTEIAALGHILAADVAVAPTCTDSGLTAGLHCTRCEQILQEQQTIDSLGHDLRTDVATLPTCTQTGLTEGSHCTRCDYVLVQQSIPALGHDYAQTVMQPTCIAGGFTTHTCSRCNDTYKDTATEPLGHSIVTDAAILPTCTKTGLTEGSHCSRCSEMLVQQQTVSAMGHDYFGTVTAPTYFAQGYTTYVCNRCGESRVDDYTPLIERTPLSETELTLEYTAAFYKGVALQPGVTLCYEGQTYDAATELELVYANNNKVGEATVTATGINKFSGSCTLPFTISYETIPEQIRNVAAIGEIGKISVSWSTSSEVNTTIYRIYRKAEAEDGFTLLTQISGREKLSYTDLAVERETAYEYYVTGVGIYGEESEPSLTVAARPAIDREAPVITKFLPVGGTRIAATVSLSAQVSDNVGVTAVKYAYSTDNETWTLIGISQTSGFIRSFDTTALDDHIVTVRAVAYDAEDNESTPYVRTYLIDNTPPSQVTQLRTTSVYCNKFTLMWDDVPDTDRAGYIVQMKQGESWKTLQNGSVLGCNVSNLSARTTYTLRIAARDICGNQGQWSEEFSVTTAADTSAPVITSLKPGGYRLNADFVFSAAVADECGVASVSIQASNDLTAWTDINTTTYNPSRTSAVCSWTVDVSQFSEGYFYLRAIAEDDFGNRTATDLSTAYNGYYYDTTAPEAPDGVSAAGRNGYIAVEWQQGDEEGLSYSVYRATTQDGTYSCIASGLKTVNYHDRKIATDIIYYYKVAVSDSVGNLSEQSAAFSAKALDDSQPPVIHSFSQIYNDAISPVYHTISVLASDNNTLQKIVLEYKTDADAAYTLLTEQSIQNNYSGQLSASLPLTGLTHGDTIYLRAYAVDMAGNTSQMMSKEYVLDTEAPGVQSFAAQVEQTICTLRWQDSTRTDTNGFRIYRSVDSGAYQTLGSRSVRADGSYSITDNLTLTGTHTYSYRLEAIDILGNAASVLTEVTQTVEASGSGTPGEEIIYNEPPVLRMDVPAYMEMGVEQYFDASGSTDDEEIASYLWDFGDGTVSALAKAVKKYSLAGNYTVCLTVTDNKGLSTTRSYTVEVRQRSELGTLSVKVVDDNQKPLANARVLVDKGTENEQSVYTDSSGTAKLQLPTGEHEIAAYADSHHLPAKKTVTLLANALRSVSLILVEEEMVAGEFEITRMSLEEIKAAGIDVYDPANHNVYQVNVRVVYGGWPLNIQYIRNDSRILTSRITDADNKSLPGNTITMPSGEQRQLKPVVIPSSHYTSDSTTQGDIVAILDIPAQVSYLKEFFDVKLYITNHAAEDFTLTQNEVTLNVPDGIRLVTGLPAYESTKSVELPTIAGQQTVMLCWCLEGQLEGEYELSADYIGNLTYFDELITAQFKADEPIKVYGLDGVEVSILACDEIHNGAFYFKIGLENQRPVDLHMPNIGLNGAVTNVTESLLSNNPEADFTVENYILNIYLEAANGAKQYLPIRYDANWNVIPQVELLAPGQKLVYEYVCYNAVQSDEIAVFNHAMVEVLSGYAENVVVGSYERPGYDLEDFSEKLDNILQGNSGAVRNAYDYIMNPGNFYYVATAKDSTKNIFTNIVEKLNLILEFDLNYLTMEEERDFAQQLINKLLLDPEVIDAIDDQVALEYLSIVTNTISKVKLGTLTEYGLSEADFNTVVGFCEDDFYTLTRTLAKDGTEAFKTQLYTIIQSRASSYITDIGANLFYDSIGLSEVVSYESFTGALGSLSGSFLKTLNTFSSTLERSYVYSTLYAQASYDYSNFALDALIDYCRQAAIDSVSFEHCLLNVTFPASGIVTDQTDRIAIAIAVTAEECKLAVRQDAEARAAIEAILFADFAADVALDVLAAKAGQYVADALGAPYAIAGTIWKGASNFFALGEYVKQQESMVIYHYFSEALALKFRQYIASGQRTQTNDLYALSMLKSICEMRLDGERQYKTAVTMYIDRADGYSITEEEGMSLINEVMNTGYDTVAAWYSDVRYNLLSARDILFNKGITQELTIPAAPVVTLDYEQNQTVQSFSAAYEYSLADGVWQPCRSEPIPFTPKGVQSVLRVRMAASGENLAGNITTVFIYASKQLSKIITVKHDGTQFLIDNLTAGREYQMTFADAPEDAVNWENALAFTASEGQTAVPSLQNCGYAIVRTTISPADNETYSLPLLRTVEKRSRLPLSITGSGTVSQTRADGCYFTGETVALTAIANTGYELEGWYVDGLRVSGDTLYFYETGTSETIEARFTGAQPRRLIITSMPTKLTYTDGEALDMTGFSLMVQYADGTELPTSNYTASIEKAARRSSSEMAAEIAVRVGSLRVGIPVTVVHEQGQWETTTAPTCTDEGSKVLRCVNCGELLEPRQTISALGHEYTVQTVLPQDNELGYDEHTCSRCGDSYRDAYRGYDASLLFKRASLTLESDISINFYVLDSVLEGLNEPYVVFTKALYDTHGNITGYTTETVSEYETRTIDNSIACHVYTFKGIYYTEMGSAVTATLFGSKDELLYEGATVNYSVWQYASNMLQKTDDVGLKTLLVDLLNFGAETQAYFDYNADNPVNAGLTAEQKGYATQADPALTTCSRLVQNAGATVNFKTCTLLMEEKVGMNIYLNLANYEGDIHDLNVRITFTDTDGVTRTTVIESSELEYKPYGGSNYYVAHFTALNALQMRTVCEVEVFSKASGRRISNTLYYSIESYAYSKAGGSDAGLAALVKAMMKYGISTEKLFLPGAVQ